METANQAEAKVMRTIVAREHRTALAERREAIAAHKAATAPTRSNVGWSTKAPPRRKQTLAEKAIADRVMDAKQRWRDTNPEVAAAERAIRKERAEVEERWDHKAHGTPQTHEHFARTREGSLARLCQSGTIDAEQLASALEIAGVYERIGADVVVKTASLETRIDSNRHGDAFFEALGNVRRDMAYTRWRAQVQAQGPIAAVLDMIVGETVGFTVVATRYRMHNRRAKKLLIDALDLWPRILRGVCKEVDAATLAAAHVGILA